MALVTGKGARVASGRVTVDEIVRGFDTLEPGLAASAMPLELLVATDVLSEGLSLRRAGVIVHLDLPWTVARLEQRVGRLRRIGSPHRRISVYAIGPPVEARELVTVVRALQRKARLASKVTGIEELQSALPLLGARLTRATSAIASRGDTSANEELRRALSAWACGENGTIETRLAMAESQGVVALGLVGDGTKHRLVAVRSSRVSERPSDVLHAVRILSHAPGFESRPGPDAAVATRAIAIWLDEKRGREIAKPATNSPSPAHVAVLRALQDMLTSTIRAERTTIATRINRCRQLVIAARGIGAELALAGLIDSSEPLDLETLEPLLESRRLHDETSPGDARLLALLCDRT